MNCKKIIIITGSIVVLSVSTACGAASAPKATEAALPVETRTEVPSVTEPMVKAKALAPAKSEFQLTEAGNTFLLKMCYYLPEFADPADQNDEFWHNFIFMSYTGVGNNEYELVNVYREDLGFDEQQVKVSREEVARYVKLALGVDLPAYEPAFDDIPDMQTACYYADGFYYVGVSDFGDTLYEYKSFVTAEDGTVSVEYIMSDGGGEAYGIVTFKLAQVNNENGFIVIGKSISKS